MTENKKKLENTDGTEKQKSNLLVAPKKRSSKIPREVDFESAKLS